METKSLQRRFENLVPSIAPSDRQRWQSHHRCKSSFAPNGRAIGLQFPPHVELTVTYTEPAVRGDTSSGNVTKLATLDTGMEIRVPLFIKQGEKIKVHTETREFAGRA